MRILQLGRSPQVRQQRHWRSCRVQTLVTVRPYRVLGLLLAAIGLTLAMNAAVQAQGDRVLTLSSDQQSYPVDLYLDILVDPSGALTIDDVTQPDVATQFVPNTKRSPGFGNTDATIWARFDTRNATNNLDWRLVFGDAQVAQIDFYYPAADGNGFVHERSGYATPPAERPSSYPHFVFDLALEPGTQTPVYLRMQDRLAVQFWLTLWPAALFAQQDHTYFLWLGLAYGMLGLMAVYNLVVFALLRKRQYLYYLLFLAGTTLWLAMRDGLIPAFSSLQSIGCRQYRDSGTGECGHVGLWHTICSCVSGVTRTRALARLCHARVDRARSADAGCRGCHAAQLCSGDHTGPGYDYCRNPGRRARLTATSSACTVLFACLGRLSGHSGNT